MYDYRKEEDRRKLAIDLAKAKPSSGYNLFRKFGLVQDAQRINAVMEKTAIHQFTQVSDSFEAEAEDVVLSFDDTLLRDLMGTFEFILPMQTVPSVVNDAEHRKLVASFRDRLDSFEFETAMIVAGGMRGIKKGWKVYREPQSDPEKLPEAIVNLSKKYPVTTPSLNFAQWQTTEQKRSSEVIDYTEPVRAASYLETLASLYDSIHLPHEGNPVFDGIMPTKIRFPENGFNIDGCESLDRYVLFVSIDQANKIRTDLRADLERCDEWVHPRNDSTGAHHSNSDILGLYNNMVIIRNPCVPIFTRDGHRFSRALLFGRQAMVMVSKASYEGMPEGLLTPYKCKFTNMNNGRIAVDIFLSFGVKRMTYRSGLEGAKLGDCGIVAFDMHEGKRS